MFSLPNLRRGFRISRALLAVVAAVSAISLAPAQLAALGGLPLGSKYAVGPGDEIAVTVLRHPEFSGSFVVPNNGLVDVPAAGNVWVLGATLDTIGKSITTKLRTRLMHPEVSVRLVAARGMKVYVLGDVKSSGGYDLRPGWGVAETLSAAGGINADVQRKDVRLTVEHPNGTKIQMPLEAALARGSDDTLRVAAGDVLRFDTVSTLPVYVTGKVKNPGMYKLREDSTGLLAAVAQAGGVTDDAALGNVKVIHAMGTEEVVDLTPSLVRGESSKLPKLESGDMIVVSESLARYAVLGYVQKAGNFPLPQGRTITLSDAVAEAQGTDKRAGISKIGMVRTVNGKQVQSVYDLNKYFKKGDMSQNPTIQAGDVVYVPETGRADNGTIFSALGTTVGFLNLFRRY